MSNYAVDKRLGLRVLVHLVCGLWLMLLSRAMGCLELGSEWGLALGFCVGYVDAFILQKLALFP